MRLVHRQRTGFFRHLPLFFVILSVPMLACGAIAAQGNVDPSSSVSASDGSEDPEGLLELYLEFALRKMRAPFPAMKTAEALSNAVIRSYEEQGTPILKPLDELEFINTLVLTQAHLAAYPELLDADTTDRLNIALAGMLDDLVGEVRVAP